MRSPKRVIWRKVQKGRTKGDTTRGNALDFGTMGLKAIEPARISSRQLEAGRVSINRTLKRGGQMFIRSFPDLPVSKKPAEVRMGSGKGGLDRYVARTYPGGIIYETTGVDNAVMKEALRKASHRMPCKCKIVSIDTMLAVYAKHSHIITNPSQCITNNIKGDNNG